MSVSGQKANDNLLYFLLPLSLVIFIRLALAMFWGRNPRDSSIQAKTAMIKKKAIPGVTLTGNYNRPFSQTSSLTVVSIFCRLQNSFITFHSSTWLPWHLPQATARVWYSGIPKFPFFKSETQQIPQDHTHLRHTKNVLNYFRVCSFISLVGRM